MEEALRRSECPGLADYGLMLRSPFDPNRSFAVAINRCSECSERHYSSRVARSAFAPRRLSNDISGW